MVRHTRNKNGRTSAANQLESMATKLPGGVEKIHSSLEERVRSEFRSAWEGIFSRMGINIQDVPIKNLNPTWPTIKPINTQGKPYGQCNTAQIMNNGSRIYARVVKSKENTNIDLAGSFFPIVLKLNQSDSPADPNLA